MKFYLILCFCTIFVISCFADLIELDVLWSGGTDDCLCEGDTYACTQGSGAGDWANGIQSYHDLQSDPSFILSQVQIDIYGSFDCYSAQAIILSLNDQQVGTVEIPISKDGSCDECRNCYADFSPVSFISRVYPEGFPLYNEGYPNNVSISFPYPITSNDTHFCINKLSLFLLYNQTTEVSDSSSSSNDINLVAPPWFWSLVAAGGVILLVLVLTLFVLWRRSTSTHRVHKGDKDKGIYRPLSTTEYLDPEQLEDIRIEFSEFTIDCQIGHGSFGLVHKALWRGTEVAVKRLPRESMAEKHLQIEFMKEAFIMRHLRHPNVLQVLGVCTEPPSIIMEYMPRGSLHQLIHTPSVALDWPTVRKLAVEICRGMAYLHGCNPPLIHRDLKPHNLLVDDLWRVKVCDFGLSRFWEAKRDMTACGTPAYAAPEVLRNSAYTKSADVFSFSMVLWELITRQPPYAGTPPFQIIFTVGTQGVRPTIPPTCDESIARIIRECWSEDPSQRPDFVTLADRIGQLP